VNKKLSDWASIAGIISGLAVVATLAFLAIEMRGNTNAMQAQTFQALMQEINDYRSYLSEPDWVDSREKFDTEGWERLTAREKQTVRIPFLVLWGIYESAYYANERGVLGEREWIRFELAICRQYSSGADLWEPKDATPITLLLTPDFVQYIAGSCR